MRTEIERLKPSEALAKYPPETKVALLIPSSSIGFYNQDKKIYYDVPLEEAWSTTLADSRSKCWGDQCVVVVFTETPPDPNAPVKKCRVHQAFRPAVLDLLKHAPLNPVARAHAMNDLKLALPDECKTFEEITTWVEANCEPMKSASVIIRRGRPRDVTTAFEILVEESETEHGRASYSCYRHGEANVPIPTGIVLEAVREAIDNRDGIESAIDSLSDYLNENASDHIQMDSDDFEYNDEEADESDNHEMDFRRREIEQKIRDWLHESNPELGEQLEQ